MAFDNERSGFEFPSHIREPKIDYSWWERLQECWRTSEHHKKEWSEYLTMLVNKGLEALENLEPPAAARLLDDNKSICENKRITIKPTINSGMGDRVNIYCRNNNDRPAVVAICTRIGHDLICLKRA